MGYVNYSEIETQMNIRQISILTLESITIGRLFPNSRRRLFRIEKQNVLSSYLRI